MHPDNIRQWAMSIIEGTMKPLNYIEEATQHRNKKKGINSTKKEKSLDAKEIEALLPNV